jgi:hypothetical protein
MTSLAEFSKEGYGSKRAVLPIVVVAIIIFIIIIIEATQYEKGAGIA